MKLLKLLLALMLAVHLSVPEANAQTPACAGNGAGEPKCAGAGNPINVITGNKFQRDVDLPALPGVLGLEVVRYYNSNLSGMGRRSGILGRGWRLSYEATLAAIGDTVQIIEADGRRIIFARDPLHPSLCSSMDPANGQIDVRRTPDGDEYLWRKTDGQRLSFNTQGRLVQIFAPSGEFVSMQHDARGWLVKVTDPQGRSLNLKYLDKRDAAKGDRFQGVQSIDTPVGRFTYGYGSELPKGGDHAQRREILANLVRVGMPDGSIRQYHYEDARFPTLLTGISVQGADAAGKPVMQRFATFGYDGNAKAILSTHANNVGRITLDTSIGGQTVLSNSFGQKTVYRYSLIAGEVRLQEVRGAGCAQCGEMDVRYGYDALGRKTSVTHLDQSGVPISAETAKYDYYGRPLEVRRVDYRDGKPVQTRLVMRVEYAAGTGLRPAFIARPSVVPGKELVTRIKYNAAGQPVSISESGWSPTFDGKDAAASIERTIRYRYATVNGRSLLSEIDGPLANGKSNSPADSDITVFQYDDVSGTSGQPQHERRNGLLTRVIAPGGSFTQVLERDAALRPTKLRSTDGWTTQEMNVASNWRGDPLGLELTAGTLRWALRYEYNAVGKISAVTLPGGLRTSIAFDNAGRPSLTVFADGSGSRSELDSEDRLVRSTRLLDALAAGTALVDEKFAYSRVADQAGRLMQVMDAVGTIERYSYNNMGQLAEVRSALGSTTVFQHDAAGQLTSRTEAFGSADAARMGLVYDLVGHATEITAPNGVKTLRRYDDFGRKVMEADPDHGATVFRYDAAGRLVARVDESMTVTRFMYDHAGRLLSMGADGSSNLVQYRYQGRQVVSMISSSDGKPEHASERIVYERDAFGRIRKESRWLANVTPRPNAPAGFTFVTTSDYDDAGRLVSQRLPDGHLLEYRFAPVGGSRENGRHPGQLAAILFDGSVIITDIEQTVAGGLTGYTFGNGARQQVSLDSRGRIQQLQVVAGNAVRAANWWDWLTAWLPGNEKIVPDSLYRQVNKYDADNRITQIDRQSVQGETGRKQLARTEGFSYDLMNRLTAIYSETGEINRFRYDKSGNRMVETFETSGSNGESAATSKRTNRYAYAPGSNQLVSIGTDGPVPVGNPAAPRNSADAARFIRQSWFYHATGVPLAHLLWTGQGDSAAQRIVYNSGKRPIAVYSNEQLLARYHYNVQGERVAKTVYSEPRVIRASYEQGQKTARTTYFLYENHQLAAETDSAGRTTTHYVYLYGKAVAKIEMGPAQSWLHRLWKAVTGYTMSGSDTEGRVYAVVGDHLGMPQLVLDERRHIVWQAESGPFGQTRVTYAARTGDDEHPFEMNLRLPGQVFDPETHLHYNYLRDYDPLLGRYTSPDPIGLGGGFNPYSYVSNNPLTNIDPLGLYQSDVHYYMTFFLALAAGLDRDDARTMALATQYVDDNPITKPIDTDEKGEPEYIKSVFHNQARLKFYHFTLSDSESGKTLKDYAITDVNYPISHPSPQLQNLRGAADKAAEKCAKLQFFGEYLHAFEDTFSHRDSYNFPIDAVWDVPFTTKQLGIGHGLQGSNPDYTYNHHLSLSQYLPFFAIWDVNEERTLKMEKAVYDKIVELKNMLHIKSEGVGFEKIEQTLRRFNATKANEDTKDEALVEGRTNFKSKIQELDKALRDVVGVQGIDTLQDEGYGYNPATARDAKEKNTKGLNPADFPGTCINSCPERLPDAPPEAPGAPLPGPVN